MRPPTDDDVLGHALLYAARGWRVVPIRPGHKRPALVNWPDVATVDPELIEQWWTGPYRDHGVGIVTGPESGLFVLDVDVANGASGDVSFAELEAIHGPMPHTIETVTGSGGRHLYFQWNPDRPVRNNQSGALGPNVDVRGDGGQVLAPPTLHPVTGRAYRWRPGHEPW